MDDRLGEMLDTSAEARASYFEQLARLSPAERAQRVAALGRTARAFARAGILRTRPDATPDEVEIELVARLYGSDVARRLAPFIRATRG